MPPLSTSSTPKTVPALPDLVRWLDGAAFATLAILPLGMALANRSAPAIMVVAALLAGSARLADGAAAHVGRRAALLFRSRIALPCAALAAFAAVSIGWSGHRAISLHAFGEVVLALAAALLLHLCLPRRIPAWTLRVAVIATTLGCLAIVSELATGLALRKQLGLRSAEFIFKRSVTCTVILFWPVAAMLAARGQAWIAAALGLLIAVAVVTAHAGAALFGLIAGVAMLAIGVARPRLATGLIEALLLVALVGAPVVGSLAARSFSEPVLDRMERVQMRDRILIWQSFGEVVAHRPWLGTGFGTSVALGRDPVADEVPADRRLMLAVGHPHNGFLQVWTELGLVGAALTACVFLGLVGRVGRTADSLGPSCALIACAVAIMLVGHGAWQGWWIATLGAASVWFSRVPRPASTRRERSDGQSASSSGPSGTSGPSPAVPRKPIAST